MDSLTGLAVKVYDQDVTSSITGTDQKGVIMFFWLKECLKTSRSLEDGVLTPVKPLALRLIPPRSCRIAVLSDCENGGTEHYILMYYNISSVVGWSTLKLATVNEIG